MIFHTQCAHRIFLHCIRKWIQICLVCLLTKHLSYIVLCKQYGIDHKNLTHFEKRARKKNCFFEHLLCRSKSTTRIRMPWAINHLIGGCVCSSNAVCDHDKIPNIMPNLFNSIYGLSFAQRCVQFSIILFDFSHDPHKTTHRPGKKKVLKTNRTHVIRIVFYCCRSNVFIRTDWLNV